MLKILETLSAEERERYLEQAPGGEKSWGEKVRELALLGKGFYIFEGLDRVVALLEGGEAGVGGEEGSDGGDDDESEEDQESDSGE